MEQYVNKSDIVAEIKRIMDAENESINSFEHHRNASEKQRYNARMALLEHILSFLNNLEVKDPYEERIQYDSIKAGIQAHAETYSFNIESELFNQLTKEQQALWRKEIEQACISGGEAGVELARDPRYKENFEVKENDLVEVLDYNDYTTFFKEHPEYTNGDWGFEETWTFGQYCYTLGLNAQKAEEIE